MTIGFQTQTGKSTYAYDLSQTGNFATIVSGLGDKAFYNKTNPGGNTSLQVLKGNTLLSFNATASLSKVEKLAKQIAATL